MPNVLPGKGIVSERLRHAVRRTCSGNPNGSRNIFIEPSKSPAERIAWVPSFGSSLTHHDGEPMASVPNTASSTRERLDEIVRRYYAPLLSFFRKRTRNSPEVPDLVQQVFLRLAQRPDAHTVENPDAYIFQTASNALKDHYRRMSVRERHIDSNGCEDDATDPGSLRPVALSEWPWGAKRWRDYRARCVSCPSARETYSCSVVSKD